MKSLVIVESPNKIKSLEKYLGKEYQVLSSVGHIVRLPSSGQHGFGIDMESWTPLYKVDPKKKKLVAQLKKATKNKKWIYIATDPDREGEAIGDNLVTFLNLGDNYRRIRFNEITEAAVLQAISKPTIIDHELVNSQIARRILDRIIGYKLSTLMRKKINNSPITPSAGRVQSIALKLVVKREEEIEKFIPIKYATIDAQIKTGLNASLISGNFNEKKEWVDPQKLDTTLNSFTKELIVKSRKISKRKDKILEPLKQSTLYKKASSSLGLAARSVRNATQRLYEGYGDGGLISYPRTDSTRLSKTFVENARLFIEKKYGKKYIYENIKGSAGEQDAHESIRPTNLDLDPETARTRFNLNANEVNVYRLVYNHTLMCLIKPAVREITRYDFTDNQNQFKLSCSNVIFDGYLIISGDSRNEVCGDFAVGQKIPILKYEVKNLQTSPPARYNDGSLIETLDKIKVGRPSTFEVIVSTLKDRFYVDLEGRAFIATDFGKTIYAKLIESFPKILNEKYTAGMEKQLDSVANGKNSYQKILSEFWEDFEKEVEIATETMTLTKLSAIPAGKDCPKCNRPMVVRINKKERTKFFACSGFPECKHTESDPSQPKRKAYRKPPSGEASKSDSKQPNREAYNNPPSGEASKSGSNQPKKETYSKPPNDETPKSEQL